MSEDNPIEQLNDIDAAVGNVRDWIEDAIARIEQLEDAVVQANRQIEALEAQVQQQESARRPAQNRPTEPGSYWIKVSTTGRWVAYDIIQLFGTPGKWGGPSPEVIETWRRIPEPTE